MLRLADIREQLFFLVGFKISVFISEDPDIGSTRNDDLRVLARRCGEHADSERRIDFVALVENRLLVRNSIAICILDDENAISLFTFAVTLSVVDHLNDPDSTQVVNIDVSGAKHARSFGCE